MEIHADVMILVEKYTRVKHNNLLMPVSLLIYSNKAGSGGGRRGTGDD